MSPTSTRSAGIRGDRDPEHRVGGSRARGGSVDPSIEIAPREPSIDRDSPEWRRLTSQVRSLTSDLEALSSALQDIGPDSADRSRDEEVAGALREPWPPPWFLAPADDRARLESVGLRIAQLQTSLSALSSVVRAARGEPALVEVRPPRTSSRPRRRRENPKDSNRPRTPSGTAPRAREELPRDIGGPVRPSLNAFLSAVRKDRLDLQMLNALPLSTLLDEAHGDRELLDAALRVADDLMLRVRELDDPRNAGEFLREQVRLWYCESASDPQWASRMSERWAGLLADSRAHGGRVRPWLNQRLWELRERARQAGTLGHKLLRRLRGDDAPNEAIAREPSQWIRAEVAQAILDDLATHARDPVIPLPLISLSELALRRQIATVNESLAQLFAVPETGPFVVLHPNRYPECEEVVIRPPTPRTRGAAIAYTLGPANASIRSGVRGPPTDLVPDAASASATGTSTNLPETGDPIVDSETVWEAAAVTPASWHHLVLSTAGSKGRLSAPPSDFRSRAAYPALMKLVMEDAEFRRSFLQVRWRARPAGPPLLASLLDSGRFVPEVTTDPEYLEAELGEMVRLRLASADGDGKWRLGAVTVRRRGESRTGLRYEAKIEAA